MEVIRDPKPLRFISISPAAAGQPTQPQAQRPAPARPVPSRRAQRRAQQHREWAIEAEVERTMGQPKAYLQGYEAYKGAVRLDECPHDWRASEADNWLWRRGWLDARNKLGRKRASELASEAKCHLLFYGGVVGVIVALASYLALTGQLS